MLFRQLDGYQQILESVVNEMDFIGFKVWILNKYNIWPYKMAKLYKK